MSDYPDYLPLGPGPRPTDGPGLVERVRVVAREQDLGGAMSSATDDILRRTTVVLDGDDVTSAVVDATGVSIPESAFTSEPTVPAKLPAVVAATPGVLRRGSFRAHPLLVAEVPVVIDAEVSDLPIQWIDASDGTVGVEPLPPTAEQPISGFLRVSAPKQEVIDTVRRIATAVLAEQGITLTRLDVELTSVGPREVRLQADAKLRRGILSASAQASGSASVDQALVLRFADVRLGSANPIVAGLLAVARGRVKEATQRPIDLAEQLPPGVRVTDVQLDAGAELTLSARLA
ncbi:hypothetical protein C8046_08900 [Serinibacter arcticus]|uniref:Uncharacterized protein n=1 Tax=Serinibacter arcticus TaxID=1655435 RepID=A0A2U1ZUU2_9MICO|nr:hypothetical protein [Serinibacter arcticus]PWD50744.1 hypothetical protein C8046_08900 [Serinibacter arcticus]